MSSSVPPASTAAVLNTACQCVLMEDALLEEALRREGAKFGAAELLTGHPNLFSRSGVFVQRRTLEQMHAVAQAVERVACLPGYLELALSSSHPHARIATRARAVFMGYDFHLSGAGPQLIEINTNAGGALLNAVLRRAQRSCCAEVARILDPSAERFEDRIAAMFEQEWRLCRGDAPLRSVAIVDDDPEAQYLYPEFLLCRELLRQRGYDAFVCDARELSVVAGRLTHDGRAIDVVYNRLTDFALSEDHHAALAQAYREDLAVVTPHPRAHALFADKRRLVTLSDPAALASLGAHPADIELLTQHVPRTVLVAESMREELWSERKTLFFKPQSGYGSKAAYRGDKLTKGVFEHVLGQPYVAQKLVPPSARVLRVGDELRELKVDIRNFVYAGETQLVCARLYQGQTTNFRTLGGGFAPVYETGE